MVALLVDPMLKRTVPISKSPFLVGRQSGSDYQVTSLLVSRTHCTFVNHEGRLMVWDAGSRNGTLLNGQPLDPGKPVQVHDGDRLFVGSNEFVVRINRAMELEPFLVGYDEPEANPSAATGDSFEQADDRSGGEEPPGPNPDRGSDQGVRTKDR